ncbi:hypothetical protein PGT21_034171 [Puccinia graminis f. sp. tritici]|uniref:Uncharacterized protein n=1 Tax=Puccinia graminis f. sp. tritici TaxID=56615 RepID=A0A5B0MR35_PUCGR|nr:hypothetical protein PGT21_034171 [Puccinia graminis f. sp. tritici]
MNSFTIFAALLVLSLEINAHSPDSYMAQPHSHLPASEAYNSPSLPSHAVVPTHNTTPLKGSNSQISNGSNGYLEPVFSGHATPKPDSALHEGAHSGAYTNPGATARPVQPTPSLQGMIPGAFDTKHAPVLHPAGGPKEAGSSSGLPDYTPSSEPFSGHQAGPGSLGYGAPKRDVIAARAADLQPRTSRCIIPRRCRAPVHCVSPTSCRALAKYCWKKASRCGYTY